MGGISCHARGCERDQQNEACVVSSALSTVEGIPFPQVTSYKRMPEAGSHLRTPPKTTSLRAELTTVNLLFGSPVAIPSTGGT